jgi:hypothetical protein
LGIVYHVTDPDPDPKGRAQYDPNPDPSPDPRSTRGSGQILNTLITYDGVDLAKVEAVAESSRRIVIVGRPTIDLAIENYKVLGSMGSKVVCFFRSSRLYTPLTELFTRKNCKVCWRSRLRVESRPMCSITTR